MREQGHRTASLVVRELLFAVASVVAAWLFLNHGLLYLGPGEAPPASPLTAYLLTAAIAYAFLRGVPVLAAWRLPRLAAAADTCPACGQPLEDGTPSGVRVRTPGPPYHAERVAHVRVRASPAAPVANLAGGPGRDRLG